MFIIPVQDRIDWRRPPLLTIALVVINCLIYFWSVRYDDARYQQLDALPYDLVVEKEWPLYLDYLSEQSPADWLVVREYSGDAREQEMLSALFDWGYSSWLQQYWQHTPPDPAWRAQHQALQQARDQLSWVRWGFTPSTPSLSAAFVSMFLHGDIGHLFGNMLFLVLFAAALERHWGARYLLPIYLLGGLCSNLLYWLVDMSNGVPGIGASGAISALMGAYVATYGLRRIEFFYSIGLLFGSFHAPALIVFPIWLGWELLQNLLSDNNVNYMAHAGGLIGGVLVTWAVIRLRGPVSLDAAATAPRRGESPVAAVPASLTRLTEQLAFDRAATECQALLKQQPGNRALWQFYLDTCARCNARRRDQAMGEALALLNVAQPPDALVMSLLQQYQKAGGDTAALSPPFRLLEAELYFRQNRAAQAHQAALSLSQTWQHPRLKKLITQLEIS